MQTEKLRSAGDVLKSDVSMCWSDASPAVLPADAVMVVVAVV